MVPELKSLPYEERLDHLGIWTLEERRNRADLLPVFKLYNGWSSTQFGHLFIISTVTNTRGHTAKTDKPRCHLDLQRSFFSHCVIYRQMEWTTTKRDTLVQSTLSRTGSTSWERIGWASSWTSHTW